MLKYCGWSYHERSLCPVSFRNKTLETLHSSQMGITKTIEHARTSLFWPNMQKYIIAHSSSCHPCAEFKIKQKPEPLSYDVPMVLWHSLTLDNFEFKGTHYLLVYDRFSRFIVVKKSDSLSTRSTIRLLLEIFTGVPSSTRCDCGSNFLSLEFNTFCSDLDISLCFSSAYHHSSNMAEWAVRTIKDLMHRCYSAGVSWRLALIEFLSNPGPDGKSPAELYGHQFKGILPVLNPKTNEHDSDLFSERKESEKKTFNVSSKQLPVLFVGSYVNYLNNDMKSWSIGTVHARSHDDRSYEILTENGNLISRNHVHLQPTNVQPIDRLTKPCKVNARVDMLPKASGVPVSHNHDKVIKANKPSIKNAAKTNDVPYRTRSGREV